MRITRKNYEKSKKLVEEAQAQVKLVKLWEDATAQLGELGKHQLVAITVNDDGSIRTECELVYASRGGSASENQSL